MNLRYPNMPEDRTVEVSFLPVGGEDTPRERNRPLEGLEAFPGMLEELGSALRARYDAVLIDAPTGEVETTALLASHIADKLVLVVDDASLEEAIELGAWAHGRRAIASTDRPLFVFPLLVHVAEGSASRAFVDEARPRLEALLRSTLALPSCDLSVYLELAQIPRRSVRTPPGRLAAEVEPTSDPQGLAHAYFRFVQCLSKTSPIKVGGRSRPLSAELLSAIEARRSATPDAATRVPADRQSSPDIPAPRSASIPPARGRAAGTNPRVRRSAPIRSRRASSRPSTPSGSPRRWPSARKAATPRPRRSAPRSCGKRCATSAAARRRPRPSSRSVISARRRRRASTTRSCGASTSAGTRTRRSSSPCCSRSTEGASGTRRARGIALATDSLAAALELAGEWRFPGQASSVDLRALAADAALVLAVISIERGDDARAFAALEQAIAATAGGTSAAQRETEAAAASLEVLVLSRAGMPEQAAEKGAALREKLGAAQGSPLDVIAALAACNEGAALGLAGRYAEARALLSSLRERLMGTWQSPYYEIAMAAAFNEAAVLARSGRAEEALERLARLRKAGGSVGAAIHRMRFAASLGEGLVHAENGRYEPAIESLESLQDALRWTDVCLDHPGDAYMRERRADVAWYLTLGRERARGVDELPGLLQASEEEGDARHGRVHLRAAFELARHERRLDDLGAHRAAGACHEEAMARLERAGSRPPGDAAMIACAGLVALSRNDTQRGIPLLRKAAEQGGTAALQWALERVRAEGVDVEALVAAVRDAFDWVPRERTDALRAADAVGATLIRALVYPGRPPEPLMPSIPFPPCAARFAACTTPPFTGREPFAPGASAVASVCRLLLLEPPDGTEDGLASFAANAGSARGDEREKLYARRPQPSRRPSWPAPLGTFHGHGRRADERARGALSAWGGHRSAARLVVLAPGRRPDGAATHGARGGGA